MNTTKWILCLGACVLGLQLQAAPMGSAFTYQGRLNSSSGPALDGIYDFRFTLFDAETGGAVAGVGPYYVGDLPVTNGLFTARLYFLTLTFTSGEARWLQVEVNTNAALPLITLNPRQRLTPTPQAIYAGTAANATTAASVAAGAVGTAGIANESVTSAKIMDESIDADDLSPDLMNGRFWRLTGNSGPAVGFLGTTDSRPLELKVNSQRGWRLEPTTNTVNVIGGSQVNFAAPGVVGATIGGGGSSGYQGRAHTNSVSADFGTISGGMRNAILNRSWWATIGGGAENTIEANSQYAVIGGGGQGLIQSNANYATIGGGSANWVYPGARFATISGGVLNHIQTNAIVATIGGGEFNYIFPDANFTTIGGGRLNVIETGGSYATIGGGNFNRINQNADYATIAGGSDNWIDTNSLDGVIGGGFQNRIQRAVEGAVIDGGQFNLIQAGASFTAIGGGRDNTVQTNATYGTISGGANNLLQTRVSTLPGFEETNACLYSSIGGGELNVIQRADWATIAGGRNNVISSDYGSIPGGFLNSVSGQFGFAAGYRAKAEHTGAFVWADSANADFASTAFNQFRVRASGGMEVVGGSGNPAFHYSGSRRGGLFSPVGLAENNNATGQSAPALRVVNQGGDSIDGALSVSSHGTGSIATFGNAATFVSRLTTNGTWTALAFNATSDRNAKENFQPVNPRAVLDKVVKLPMTHWNYKAAAGVRHIGPVAQDFHEAFGVGTDEKHIATVDADGVALAAIQGLNQKVEEQRAENARLKSDLEELKQLVRALVPQSNGGAQ